VPVVSRFVRYAPKAVRYLVTAVADNLPYARRLVVTAPLTGADGGDGGDYTLAVSGATTTDRGTVKLAGQLGGTADLPEVHGLCVNDGSTATLLAMGGVADGEVLARDGTSIVGASVPSTSRLVSTSGGLTGGGDLSANRTLSITAFTGFLSKDHDPGTLTWAPDEVKVHVTYDVGTDGAFLPFAARVPATVDAALATEVVLELDDGTTRIVTNTNTATPSDQNFQGLLTQLAGSVAEAARSNGRVVRKIHFRTRNTTGATVSSIDLGEFRIRAFALPRGGGSAL
jgi:hypothetical protein